MQNSKTQKGYLSHAWQKAMAGFAAAVTISSVLAPTAAEAQTYAQSTQEQVQLDQCRNQYLANERNLNQSTYYNWQQVQSFDQTYRDTYNACVARTQSYYGNTPSYTQPYTPYSQSQTYQAPQSSYYPQTFPQQPVYQPPAYQPPAVVYAPAPPVYQSYNSAPSIIPEIIGGVILGGIIHHAIEDGHHDRGGYRGGDRGGYRFRR